MNETFIFFEIAFLAFNTLIQASKTDILLWYEIALSYFLQCSPRPQIFYNKEKSSILGAKNCRELSLVSMESPTLIHSCNLSKSVNQKL